MYQGGELRGEELRVAELVEYLGDALHGKCQADGLEVAECQGASLPVEELRVAELAVRTTLSAAAISVNPGSLGIHAATNYFVILMRSAGSSRHRTRASIGASASIIARTAHVVVIHATMHAVIAV